MATLITGDHLAGALDDGGFIKGGSPKSLEGAKYDLRMSPVVLKASFGTPVNIEKLAEDQRAQAHIEPGEVVFVKTMERLELPNNIFALLSPKRKLSHLGIIALGGLSVDPNYKGPLFVGLYNFSSSPFPLQPGRKLIAAMFYSLDGAEVAEFPIPEPLIESEEFPDDLISLIRNYKPLELRGLKEAVSTLQSQFDALQDEVRDDRTWRREFRESLDEQSRQIKSLLEGLKEEKEARKDEDKAIKSQLEGMSSFFTTARVVWAIIILLLGGAAGSYITKFLERQSSPLTNPPAVTVPQVPNAPQAPPAPRPQP